MTLTDELRRPDSPITGYLRTRLGSRIEVIGAWRRRLDAATVPAVVVDDDDASLLGEVFEQLIGLDLSPALPYRGMLAAVPGALAASLADGAGYRPTSAALSEAPMSGQVVSPFGDWQRPAGARWTPARDWLDAWWSMASILRLVRKNKASSAAARAAGFDFFDRLLGDRQHPSTAVLDALESLWRRYHDQRWAAFADLGVTVTVAPVITDAFAVADLIAGTTLIDVKVVRDPADCLDHWLDQVLGYALLDRDDHHRIDAIGLYCAQQAVFQCWELADLLPQLAAQPEVDLAQLRAEFATVSSDLIAAAQRHPRH